MKAVHVLSVCLALVLALAIIAPARADGGQTHAKPKKPAPHAVNSHFPGMDFVDCANYDSGDGKRVGDPNKPGYYQNRCPGVQNALRDTTCEGQTSGHPTKNEAAKKAALARWKQLEPQKSEYKTFRETHCKMQVFDAAAGKMVDKKTKNGGQVYKNVIAAHQDDNPNHNCASNIKWECDGEDGGNENERENDRKVEMGKPCRAQDAAGNPATGAVCKPDPESCAKSGTVATKGTKSGECWGTKNGGVCCLITAGNTISPRGDDPDKIKPKGTEPTVGDRKIWIAYRAALAADANWQARNPGCEGTAWLSNICKPKGAATTTATTTTTTTPTTPTALIDAGAGAGADADADADEDLDADVHADVDADVDAGTDTAKPHSIAEEKSEMKRVDDLLAKLDRTEKHCKEVKGKMANGKCDKDQKDKRKDKQKDCKGGKTKDGKSCKEKDKAKSQGKRKDAKAKDAKAKGKGKGKDVTGGKKRRDRKGQGLGKGKAKFKGGKGKGRGGAKQKQQKQQKPQNPKPKPKQKRTKKGNGKCDPKTKKDRRGKKCRP